MEEGAYDLILMEFQMPRLDGYADISVICEREGGVGVSYSNRRGNSHAFNDEEE